MISEQALVRAQRVRLNKFKIRTHTPIHGGHNQYLPRGYDALFKYDLSELEGLDDPSKPQSYILKAQEKCAQLFETKHSLFSTGGASMALQAAMLSLGEGGAVLIPQNAHKSVIASLILSGATPIFYKLTWDSQWGVFRDVDLADLKSKLFASDDIKGCLITSPTYEGVVPKGLASLIELCHEMELPVIVDESHGAHLALLKSAAGGLSLGADLVIHSAHKSLGSLTGTGIIHHQSDLVTLGKLEGALQLLQGTSPSYLLAASLVSCIENLCLSLQPLREQLASALLLRKSLTGIKGLEVCPNDDPVRLMLKLAGWSGEELATWLLEEHDLEVELANEQAVLFLCPLRLMRWQIRDIQKALLAASKLLMGRRRYILENQASIEAPLLPVVASNPREAFFNSASPTIEVTCPPGVPSSFPGSSLNSLLGLIDSKTKPATPAKPKFETDVFFEADFDEVEEEEPEYSLSEA